MKENQLQQNQAEALRAQKEAALSALAAAQDSTRVKQAQNDALIKNVNDLSTDLREAQAMKTKALQFVA